MTNSNRQEIPWISLVPACVPAGVTGVVTAPSHAGNDSPWTCSDLAVAWRRLLNGSEVIIETYFTEAHWALLLGPRPISLPLATQRQLAVLSAVLRGAGQKRVAIDFDLSPSTVAFDAKLALARLGICTRPSRVHPLVILAASAASCASANVPALEAGVPVAGDSGRIIVVPRPDLPLRSLLSQAEHDVVEQLIEGRCYAEISHERGTSSRTIANQIAGAFRRLGVSGRNELVQRLFILSGWMPHLPRAA